MKRRIVLISQVFPPDPASVGQHMADTARLLRAAGFGVVVLTADRGYDDPRIRYRRHEIMDGVRVIRLPLSSFGKSRNILRVLASAMFATMSVIVGLFVPRLDRVVVSTAPFTAGLAGYVLSMMRRVPLAYWVMDLNPDQMISLGQIQEKSAVARLIRAVNRLVYRRARSVVVLDRFMADRVLGQGADRSRIRIMPPWPHEEAIEQAIPHHANSFRDEHGLQGKRVIMYSGNHGWSTPIDTLLKAAGKTTDLDNVVYMFIGGGVRKAEVEEAAARLPNIRSLPYQPLERLAYSLSAADVHVVTIGNEMVGIVHPCKVYGAMLVSRPILFLGPLRSHVGDMIKRCDIGWHIDHGDVASLEALVRRVAAIDDYELDQLGRNAQALVVEEYSMEKLSSDFCAAILEQDEPRAATRAWSEQMVGQQDY